MKKFLMLITSLVLICSMAFTVSGCGNTETLADGVLTVGYTIYPPMNYLDDSNNFVGFDTELAKEVGKILKVEVNFVEINWDTKVMALNTKEIDCVWNGMTITDELKEAMSITDPYLENKQVIICQSGAASVFNSKDSLKNASEVLAEAGSAGEKVIKQVLGSDLSKYSSVGAQKDTLLEVKSSPTKVAVIDITMAKVITGASSANPDLTYVDVDFPLEQFGIGFRKDDVDTMKKVNDAIKTLKSNGKYDELMNKYYA